MYISTLPMIAKPITNVNKVFAPRHASDPLRPARLETKRGTKAMVSVPVSSAGNSKGNE